jgi:hypothetical protein
MKASFNGDHATRTAFAVADVDIRRHRERRQHLVRGLHGEHRRPVFHVARNAHRVAVAIQGMELAVRVPGFVEMHAAARSREQLRDASTL